MPAQGRVGDKAKNQADAHGCPACPHPVLGPGIAGSPDVMVNNLPALRVDDPGIHTACCTTNTWNALYGSVTVFFNGKGAYRKDDTSKHCGGLGKLIEGSPNVMTGGPMGPGAGPGGGGGSAGPGGGQGGGKAGGGKGGEDPGGGSKTEPGGGKGGGGEPGGKAEPGDPGGGKGGGDPSDPGGGKGDQPGQTEPETTGSLDVEVVDPDDAAVAQVAISLSGPSTADGTTDAGGHAMFPSLPAGSYLITATHEEFADGNSSAEVTAGPATTRITLTPKDDWSQFRGEVSKDDEPAA